MPCTTTTYQVGEEVSRFAHSEFVLVAEPGDEVDVGLDPGRVGLQADVDQTGQKVVCGGRGLVGQLQHFKHLFRAFDQAIHLVLGGQLAINLQNICRKKKW